ncbi:hypothetical protein CC85DRAFT_281897 [Cutaneotrichosporon oleaginosum]|uniref:Velvet domain-containing protein n=1 Tax=Cutaneotrichosporon oleaginosum TaxID=879819 RepID=A0A0J0XYV8_9TREE|nr:uncharacterized protein CC85DRAFT_281897 [Cutaneotrichosporon oleaginosum]KLT46245.1 hypothetical protein CC85DRAFT_281897 [Cutaneotrichosporon oleaginosum]TXT10251.1 hypothetical protein COLE_04185 [Cutaneotrichosporon oleaginosum]
MPSGSLSAPTATGSSRRERTASASSATSSQQDARALSTPVTPRHPSAATSQSHAKPRRESRESWGNPPRVASASRSASAGGSMAATPDPASERARSTELDEGARKRWEARRQAYSQLALVICQQPQRARLCSFKEENETIDRRPVDPPPVLELISRDGQYPDLLDSTQFFIRASLVSKDPVSYDEGKPCYQPQVTQSGAEATAGDVIQTPERLRHMDGTPGALCIFAKLSVRLPGPFRLKFTLYETSPDGSSEICDTVSDIFEVYSPKQFKGMHESTPLTRHLATQGLKVKIRQGNDSQGKAGNKRRASSNSQFSRQQQRSPASDALSPVPPSSAIQPQPPHLRYSQGPAGPPGGPITAPSYHSQRGLVWPGHFPYPGYHDEMGGHSATRRSPGAVDADRPRKVRRSMGHEDVYSAHDIPSRLDMTLPSPSSDLSAFSLGSGRPASASSAPPSSRHDWVRREYPPGDDGLPHLVLSPPPPQYPSSSRAAPPPSHHAAREFAYPRLPRMDSASGHPRYPPAHHRHHAIPHPHELQHHASSHYSHPHSHSLQHSHPHPHPHPHPQRHPDHSQHRPPSSPSSYSHHPRAMEYHHGYRAGPPPPASHSQYTPGSPPPVLPPIRHSRSRSPSLPRHYDRDPRA